MYSVSLIPCPPPLRRRVGGRRPADMPTCQPTNINSIPTYCHEINAAWRATKFSANICGSSR